MEVMESIKRKHSYNMCIISCFLISNSNVNAEQPIFVEWVTQ